MSDEPDPTEPQPWHEAVRRWQRRAQQEAEEAAREAADAALDGVGLPSAEEIGERVEEVIDEIERHLPIPDLPTASDALDAARRGAEWIEDQLEPLGDKLGPVRDRIDDELRRRTEEDREDNGQGEPPGENEDGGWGDAIKWFAFLLLADWLSEQELTISFDVDRALWSFDDDDEGRFDVWGKTVFTPGAPLAARVGDVMMHGDAIAPGPGSTDVWIGGKPALRVCDSHVCTKATPVFHVATGFVSTHGKVLVNGFPALRVGDYVDEGPHGLNPIVAGCPTVTVGPTAAPVECWSPDTGGGKQAPDLVPFRWTKGELGRFKGKVVLGIDIEGPFVRVEGTATAARLWAEETSVQDFPLGDVDSDGRDEALRTTTTRKSERVLGVSEVELEVHPVTRHVDKAEVTPKDPEPKDPEVSTKHEIVET